MHDYHQGRKDEAARQMRMGTGRGQPDYYAVSVLSMLYINGGTVQFTSLENWMDDEHQHELVRGSIIANNAHSL